MKCVQSETMRLWYQLNLSWFHSISTINQYIWDKMCAGYCMFWMLYSYWHLDKIQIINMCEITEKYAISMGVSVYLAHIIWILSYWHLQTTFAPILCQCMKPIQIQLVSQSHLFWTRSIWFIFVLYSNPTHFINIF